MAYKDKEWGKFVAKHYPKAGGACSTTDARIAGFKDGAKAAWSWQQEIINRLIEKVNDLDLKIKDLHLDISERNSEIRNLESEIRYFEMREYEN